MKTYRKINAESGLFIEDVRVKTIPVDEYDYIEEPVEDTFYKPKWDGEKWVEGLSEEEIKKLKKTHPIEISLEERLEQTEQLLQATTMAFTEFIFSQTMEK